MSNSADSKQSISVGKSCALRYLDKDSLPGSRMRVLINSSSIRINDTVATLPTLFRFVNHFSFGIGIPSFSSSAKTVL
jgi:hypothetical protein